MSDRTVVPRLGFQLRRRAFGDDFAVVQYDEVFREAIGLFEILGRQQHGGATFDEVLDDAPQVLSALGVQARGGLVKKENWRGRPRARPPSQVGGAFRLSTSS